MPFITVGPGEYRILSERITVTDIDAIVDEAIQTGQRSIIIFYGFPENLIPGSVRMEVRRQMEVEGVSITLMENATPAQK